MTLEAGNPCTSVMSGRSLPPIFLSGSRADYSILAKSRESGRPGVFCYRTALLPKRKF
jgi:hypothetical protein